MSAVGNRRSQVGNKRSQVGNKGGHRLETKEAKSSAEITRSQKQIKNNFRPLPSPLFTPYTIINFPSCSPLMTESKVFSNNCYKTNQAPMILTCYIASLTIHCLQYGGHIWALSWILSISEHSPGLVI